MTRMSELFSGILSLSLTASYVIVVLLFIRFSMKKFPKIYSYLLWSVVGIKLVFPFSWKRIILFFYKHLNGSLVSKEAMETMIPNVEIGNKVTEKIAVKLSPYYITMGMAIWLSGIVIFWAYTVFSIIKLKKSLKSAEEVEEGIYEKEGLPTAFVSGVVKPVIYLPKGLSAKEKKLVLIHERVHIRRKDPLIKMTAFLILSLHWFNPLVWLSFKLMTEDMELSCDERVLRELGGKAKKEYATSLLGCAVDSKMNLCNSLSFGNGNVKRRIEGVLRYKSPSAMKHFLSCLLFAFFVFGLLAVNKKEGEGRFFSELPMFEMVPKERMSYEKKIEEKDYVREKATNVKNGGIYEGKDVILYQGKERMMEISKKKGVEIKKK